MLRLFVGIPLPPEQALALSLICAGLPGMRWVDPGNFHVTIRFIGEIDEDAAADIDEQLRDLRAPRFSIGIAGLDYFGPAERPRQLVATLDRQSALLHLHDKVGAAMARAGIVPEARRFIPHVTLGRCVQVHPTEFNRFIAAHNLLRLEPFAVDRFSLIRSYLTKSGAYYEAVVSYLLK